MLSSDEIVRSLSAMLSLDVVSNCPVACLEVVESMVLAVSVSSGTTLLYDWSLSSLPVIGMQIIAGHASDASGHCRLYRS